MGRPDLSWFKDANCLGLDTNWFFIERGDVLAGADPRTLVCADCVVRQQCLEYALADESISGFWGGCSNKQRVTIRRQRKKEAA